MIRWNMLWGLLFALSGVFFYHYTTIEKSTLFLIVFIGGMIFDDGIKGDSI